MSFDYRNRGPVFPGDPDTRDMAETPHYEAVSYPSGREQVEQVLDLLYRRRWIILLTFLIVAGSVAVYTYTLKPEYEAYSYVMLDLQNRRADPVPSPTGNGDNLFATNNRTLTGEIQLLYLSDQLFRRVNSRFQQMQNGGSGQEISPIQGYPKFEPEGKQGNNIIRIIGVSDSPHEAALIANLYAQEYVHLTKEASRTHITAARELLEEQEQRRLEELRQAEEQVQAYLSREGAVGLDQEGSYLVQKIAELEAQRDEARIDLQTRRASLQALEQEIERVNPRLAERISSNVEQQIQNLQAQIAQKEIDKRQILLRNPNLAEDAPELADLNREIRQLQDVVDQLSEQYVNEVTEAGGMTGNETGFAYVANLRQQIAQERINISGLETKISVIDRRLRDYQGELRTIPEQSMELARLERLRQYAERMYQSVVERLQDVRITEESEPGYARVLREAVEPQEPVRPDKKRYLVLGIFFGLMLGLGLAMVRDKLDNRFYKPDHLRARGLSVLGTIPDLKPLIKKEHGNRPMVEHDGQRISTSLVTLLNPMSPVVEAYRHLRTNIQFSRPDRVVETILVTSSSIEEGKSTTAANLAVVMAEAGRRTVLVDADLRRPRAHEILGRDLEPGLVQFLLRSPRFDEEMVKTDIDNLYMIPAGKVVSRSSELFATKRMRDFLETLRARFDVIIIDTPPVRVATDAVLLSTQCDLALVVVRAGQTKEGELDFTLEALGGVGAPVLGAIFNGFDVSMAYGHKYRFRHYDRYAQYTSKYGYYGYHRKVDALEDDASV